MEVQHQSSRYGDTSDPYRLELSESERKVAQEICKGYSDKEVADNLCKSYWTIKTQRKTIYQKLGISKETELLWYMVCERLRINFDLKEIRKHGIEILFCVLFIIQAVTGNAGDMRRCRMARRARTEIRRE